MQGELQLTLHEIVTFKYLYYFNTFMPEVKTIRNVSEETWADFKAAAAKHGMPMGELLEVMLKEYERHANDVWDRILHGKKLLSDEEAEAMHRRLKQLRSEYGFRK